MRVASREKDAGIVTEEEANPKCQIIGKTSEGRARLLEMTDA
jgi:hypothetical protein